VIQARTRAVAPAAPATSPRLAAILPRGEAIRNFVYGGCLDDVARVVDVSIWSVQPSPAIDDLLHERYADVHPLEPVRARRLVGVARDLLEMAHGRWLWSNAAQDRWRRRDREAKTARQRARRLAKKLLCYPFANRAGLRVLSSMERAASRLLRTTDRYLEQLAATRPTLVFNASHVHSAVATPAVEAAQWLGIPTATFLFSWDNLTSQGRVLLPYDYFLVWNAAMRDQLLAIYPEIEPARVFVTGTPQFDAHFDPTNAWTREAYARRIGADPDRPIVLYTTGMPNHMPFEPEIVERIADQFADVARAPQLVVRVYPKDRTDRFDELRRRRPDILFPPIPWERNWLTPMPEDAALWSNMLRHAELGINVASTVSLELAMFDKPVLNVAYNPPSLDPVEIDYARYYGFDHYRKVVESGAVEVLAHEDALLPAVRRALAHPHERAPQRRALLRTMFGDTLDGRSGRRVAEVLAGLALDGGATTGFAR